MIKRILKFKLGDYKHLFWLLKGGIVSFIKMDFEDSDFCFFLIKLHLTRDSNFIDEN